MAGKKISNALVALSSAAILAVYTAGFERTAPAAARFAAQTEQRLTTMPTMPLQAGSFGQMPGTYQRPVAALPVVPPKESVAAPLLVSEPPAPIKEPAPVPVASAPINEPAVAPPVEETAVAAEPTPLVNEAITEAPALIAELAPEPAPTPAADLTPAPVAEPTPAVELAPVVAAKRPEPAPKAVKPPKPPKVVKADSKAVAQPAIQPAAQAEVKAAPQPAPEPAAPQAPPAPVWIDGTYYGWGSSRHGDIQAEVVIASGRIASATIARCETRYPCSVIEKAPPQVAQRQSAGVDIVAGATESIYAFYYAVLDALSKAR